MKIATFSIVAGSRVCNARCPFCVSRMTGLELGSKEPEVNWRNFGIACRLAQQNNVTTVLITGKGEPTLFPHQIDKFLEHLQPYRFPFVEMQTNGLRIANGQCDEHLRRWYDAGLTTVALSLVHYEREQNQKVYQFVGTEHYDLPAIIHKLHSVGEGFTVRLTVMLVKGFIDAPDKLDALINFCREHKVKQLTVRPIRQPGTSQDPAVSQWTQEHCLTPEQEARIANHIERIGKKVMTLSHGARIYDVGGQNLCLSDCLTIKPDTDELRQLIFFPDGSLRYDWQYPGAILL